jgi:hypothetical protein
MVVRDLLDLEDRLFHREEGKRGGREADIVGGEDSRTMALRQICVSSSQTIGVGAPRRAQRQSAVDCPN